ncbi:MAG: molecular chaperone TorD family protein, partial [Gemmatimonadota bacterium]
ARGWRLLSALYLHGPVGDVLPALRAVPPLADALPDPFDRDEADAEHHRLFGLEVFPYASVFLERDGALGGRVRDAVARIGGDAGAPGRDAGVEPDHLGHELRLLALLTERRDEDAVSRLLQGHLLWWLPVFVHSALRHAGSFWTAVLRLTLEAALDQVGTGAPVAGDSPSAAGGPGSPPHPPGALGDPVEDPTSRRETGVAELARYLVTPARSGLFLSLGDARALGRASDVPGGFGRRERVVATLLRSAAAYGRLGRVSSDLTAMADAQAAFVVRIPRSYREPWLARLERLRSVLGRLGTA